MIKHLLILTILLPASFSLARAEKSIEFSISPSLGHSYGETEYIMDIQSAFVDENGDVIVDEFGEPILFHIKSQLEYPMDVFMGGVNLRLNAAADPLNWSIVAGIFTGLNDPGGVMKDSDWDGAAGIYDFTQWSYTESSAKISALMLDVRGTKRLFRPGNMSISLLAGFRYHRIEQKLYGVEGWQRPFNEVTLSYDDAQYFSLLHDTEVLYYEVKYIMPEFGLSSSLGLSPFLTVGLETILSPVWFKDVDDHLLRYKISEADGTGLGFIGALSARYQWGPSGTQATPYIDFFAEYTTISASGNQTQEWYGDDPFTENDDTGISVSGLPHDVNATLYHVGVKVGLTF